MIVLNILYIKDMEEWKDIEGYEGIYEVSSKGQVRNIRSGKVLKQQKSDKGYCKVKLRKDGVTKEYRIHRLVAMAFIPNPDNLPQVNHKSEVKTENSVDNLEWCDDEYNNHYGTGKTRSGESRKKPIIAFDGIHKLGTYYPSTKDASVFLTGREKSSNIRMALKGNRQTALGFSWDYAVECIK